MDNTKQLRTVGFCTGYAGLERGLELAGVRIKPAAFSEIEAYPVANLLAKMEAGAIPATLIWTDLKTFPVEQFCGKVDLLTGGFPCQPFSAAGARGADDDPRHLFPYFKKFLGVVKPRYLFLENVDGIASARLKGSGWGDPVGTPVLLHVCRELERLGYTVAAGCFSAEETGAPHKRNRWFIYGELGNTQSLLSNGRGPELSWKSKIKESEFGNANRKLDNPNGSGLERHCGNEHGKGWESEGQDGPTSQASICTGNKWPAGPGGYQHNWEEPRTISYTQDSRRGGRANPAYRDDTKRLPLPEKDQQPVVRGETAGCGGDDGGAAMAHSRYERQEEQELQTSWSQQQSGLGEGRAREPNTTKPELGGATDGAPGGVDPVTNRVERLKLCGNGVVPQTAARAWITLRYAVRSGNAGNVPEYN